MVPPSKFSKNINVHRNVFSKNTRVPPCKFSKDINVHNNIFSKKKNIRVPPCIKVIVENLTPEIQGGCL